MGSKLRSALGSGAALALALLATTAEAQQRRFNLPAQDASRAIPEFARQAGVQISAPTAQLRGVRTRAIQGELDARAALRRLLDGTGLEIATDNGTMIVLRRSGEPVPGEIQAGGAAADSGSADIVVTGSRIRRLAGEGPSPVTTFDREDIDELGVTDIADVFDYVPQTSFSVAEDFLVGGAKPVQLRGLSLGTTLVLVNGRRVVTSAAQGFRNFFDLNTIPLAAVERVEILSDSASAVYGADAIGGVVNVILRDSIEAPTVDLYYGGADGGAEELRASATAGISSGPVRIIFGADYFRRSYLPGSERERFFDQDYRRFGGFDRRSTVSNPGNVVSLSGNLPGLTSNQAGVPVGSSGVGLTPASFLATQGAAGLNRESPRAFQSVIPQSSRFSAFANAEIDFAPWATGFVELLYTQRDENRQLAPTTLSNGQISNSVATRTGIVVPAANPFNPFGVPVRVNYLFEGVGPREEQLEQNFYRIVGGLRGDIGRWNYEVALLHTLDDSVTAVTNEVDPARVVAALAQTNPSMALNLFSDGPGGTPELLRSLVGPSQPNIAHSRALQLGGSLTGPLFRLPGGDLQVVIGGEHRRENLDISIPTPIAINLDEGRTTNALFGELLVPLVSRDMGVGLIHRLAITAAGRYDHYSDFGGTFNPKLGLEWQPSSDLLLRGSWGTSYRAPSLFELYFASTVQTGQFFDPLRPAQLPGQPGEAVIITLTAGGNPNLRAEEAETLTLGAVYAPVWAPGLTVSVDYFDIQQDLRVQAPDATTLIRNAALFPGRVTRAPQTPADIAAGLPGRLLALDISRLNLGSVETSGIDGRISYRFATGIGTFSPSLAVTWVESYRIADFPGQPLVERVGIGRQDGTVPEFKGVASLTYSRGGLNAGATLRFVDSYQDFNIQTATVSTRRIPAQYYVDAQLSYRFGNDAPIGPLNGLTLRVGIINAFDRFVPYSDVNIIGYDPSQSDLRGRFIYVGLTKEFR